MNALVQRLHKLAADLRAALGLSFARATQGRNACSAGNSGPLGDRPLPRKVPFGTFVALVAISSVTAAPLQRNLGDGLVYFRLRTVPEDLPDDAAIAKHPAVVDVRYAKAENGAAAVFGGWLKFHASRLQPVFVLANASTASSILAVLRDTTEPGVLTIGIAGHHFSPDIAVENPAAEEKRAYQALDDGATVTSLITDHPDKPRNDEASLTKPAPESATDDTGPSDVANPAPVPAAPIDVALQRSIQLFRGLKAMKPAA